MGYESGTPGCPLNTYNALGQRVEDVTQTSTTDEAYGAGGNLLLRYTGDSNSRSFVPFSGRILAEYYCGGMIFDHPDEIGSATTATDCAGNNVQERLYYPFGEFWTGAGNLGMHQEFAQLPDYDPETDQYNTANRHYTPSGRWLSPDPGGLKVVKVDDPQTWNMYAYVRNNPTTLTDPTGLTIDSSECDVNKQCAQWKANYLKHKDAQKQWNALDKNKDLLVKLKWDAKSGTSVTGDYKWNDAGTLTGVSVTLAGKTGHVDNPLSSSAGYVFGSTIKTDPLRQAYVIAHEFGHVEQAQEPGINVLYNWMSQQGTRLSQAEQQSGPVGYSKLDWTGPLERTLDALHLTLEQGADTRAKEVVTGDDDQ